MKKIFTLVLFSALFQPLTAQILFYEDFDGIEGPTAGGAGTYTFPAGWRLRNVDNRTPFGTVAYINEAWERREDFGAGGNVNDSCAFSTSYYSPVGVADDFMWTPLIGPITPFAVLSWRARSFDASYRDSYEVRIMTVAPTGGTGFLGNQLSNSTQVFSIAQENTNWTTRSVNLSAFAGQMVYIGFRNTSNDKFILVVDDIKVQIVIPHDAHVLAANDFEYAQIPLSQVGSGFALGGTIRNNGVNALTNVNLTARIYNSHNVLVHTQTGTAVPSLASNVTTAFTLPSWTPATTDTFTIKYFPVSDQADVVATNDTLTRSVIITDSVYARDDGIFIRPLGIGVGNGYMGQSFAITTPVDVRSITVAYGRGYVGRKYGLVVWSTTPAGVPNSMIAATDTLLYPDDNALLDTMPIYGGKITLNPGTYVVTAIEFDSTLQVMQTNGIYTPGTLWTSWNIQPWNNLENFGGGQFALSFYIRLNAMAANTLPVKVVSFTGSNTPAGNKLQWVVTEQQGIQTYEVEKSVNGVAFKKIGAVAANDRPSFTYTYTDADVTGTAFYRLKIIEDAKTTYTKIISIKIAAVNTISIAPNPVQRVLTLKSNNMQLLNTTASLLTINGKQVKQFSITRLPFTVDMSGIPAGVYLLRLYDNSVIKVLKQ